MNQIMQFGRSGFRLSLVCGDLVAIGILAWSSTAAAATYYYTTSSASVQAGNGTWSTDSTQKYWSPRPNGPGATAWSNASDWDAVFSAPGTSVVTVVGRPLVDSITFNAAGYTLTGGWLSTTIYTNANATIASDIYGGNWADYGSGILTLTGVNTYSGGISIGGWNDSKYVAGAVAVGADSARRRRRRQHRPQRHTHGNRHFCDQFGPRHQPGAGSNQISVSAGSTLTYNGQIAGASAASLAIAGGGELVLGGANAYTGPTLVNQGTLLLNGQLTASNVTVGSLGAGDLAGTGTVANLTHVMSGGALVPGNSLGAGTLSTGNATLDAGSFLDYTLGAPAAPASSRSAIP